MDIRKITDRSDASVERFIAEFRNYAPLSRKEEAELSIKIQNGDKRAEDRLVRANLKYALSIAKEFQTGQIPLNELIAQANIGVITAARRFDPELGFKFITYMKQWVIQSILDYKSNYHRAIRLPSNQVSNITKIKRFQSEFYQRNGHYPTSFEISEYLDITMKNVELILYQIKNPFSLEKTIGNSDDGSKYLDIIENEDSLSPEKSSIDASISLDLKKLLKNHLTTREADIMLKIFPLGTDGSQEISYDEIAKEHDITTERVRQIKKEAIKKLKGSRYLNTLFG